MGRLVLGLLFITSIHAIQVRATSTATFGNFIHASLACEVEGVFEAIEVKPLKHNPQSVFWKFRNIKVLRQSSQACPGGNTLDLSVRGAEPYKGKTDRITYPHFIGDTPAVGQRMKLKVRRVATEWLPLNWGDGVQALP